MSLHGWFRRNQKWIMAGLVVMLMLVWGVGSTLQRMARQAQDEWLVMGRTVNGAELNRARMALQLALTTGLMEPRLALYMQYQGGGGMAATRAQTLATTVRRFVMPGEQPQLDYGAAWRFLLLRYAAEDAGIVATTGDAADMIRSLPMLAGEEGFSVQAYQAILSRMGMNDATATQLVQQLVKVAKLVELRDSATVVSDAELWMYYNYQAEQVNVRYVEVPAELFTDVVEVTLDELQAQYERYRDVLPEESESGIGYMAPERVRLEYVLAPLSQMAEEVQVTEQDIADYYETNKEQYVVEEQAAEGGGEEEPAAEEEDGEEDEPEYRPLSEVRDEIAEELTQQRTQERANEMLTKVREDLQAVREDYENMPLPLQQMARRYGLEYTVAHTDEGQELLSRDQVADTVPAGAEVAEFAFRDYGVRYSPERFDSARGPLLVQVLERREPEVQPFEQVRDQVRSDVVRGKALERAGTFARKMQERADEVGMESAAAEMRQRLAALLGVQGEEGEDLLVVKDSGFFGRRARSVEGMGGPPPEQFVSAAFDLDTEQVAAATPQPPGRSAFVLEVAERKSPPRDEFAEQAEWLRISYLMSKQARMGEAWLEGLLQQWPLPETLEG